MKTKIHGFTLIELLVVIAIIGVLSAVVLGSLNSARNRSADSSIQATIVQVRAQSEIFYDTHKNYGAVANDGSGNPIQCDTALTVVGSLFNDSTVSRQINEEQVVSGAPWTEMMCVSVGVGNAEDWALSIPFKSSASRHWCIDNKGSSKEIPAKLAVGQTSCI